jgi:hypothetical protein
MNRVRIALFGLTVSLCVAASARADDGGLMERFVKLLERVADEADAHKPDCSKIGTALGRHLEEDAALIKDLRETNAKVPANQRKALEDFIKARYGKRIEAAHKKAAPYRACMTNAKVKKYAARVTQ